MSRIGPSSSCARCSVETPGDGEALTDLDRILTAEGRQTDLVEVLDARAAGPRTPRRATSSPSVPRASSRPSSATSRRPSAATPRSWPARPSTPGRATRSTRSPAATTTDWPRSPSSSRSSGPPSAGTASSSFSSCAWPSRTPSPLASTLLAEIARIEETERRDVQMAFAAWARALTEDATVDEPREALERLAAAHQDWARLADVYAERMDATFDAGLQRTLALRLASLYENELADLNRAADYLRKAQSLPGDEEPVLSALERDPRQAGRARRARPGAGAAGRAGQRAQRAGRLPGGAWGRCGSGRSAIPRGRSPRFATPSSATPRTRPLTPRWCRCSIAPRRRRGRSTSSSRWPRRGATTRSWSRSTAAASSCATIATSARTGCAGSPSVAADQLGQPDLALEALGRALKEEPAAGGALDDLERIAAAAKLPARGRREDRGGAGRRRARRRAGAGPAGRAPVPGGGQTRGRRAPLSAGSSSTTPRTPTRFRRWRGSTARGATPAELAAVLERRSAGELDPQVRRSRLLEAARLHEGQGNLPAAVAALQQLRAADDEDLDALKELGRLHEALGQAARAHRGAGGPRATDRGSPPAGGALVAGRRAAADAALRSRRRGRGLPRGARRRARRRAGPLGAGVDRRSPGRLVDAAGGAAAPARQRQRRRSGRGAC